MPLLEFIVDGTPRSLQGSRDGVAAWKEVVRAAARAAIREDARVDFEDVAVVIVHYCFEWGDNDGDRQHRETHFGCNLRDRHLQRQPSPLTDVRRTDLQQHSLMQIAGATPILAERVERALIDRGGFVYIAVEGDVVHGRLP